MKLYHGKGENIMKLVWSQKLYLQDPWKPALEGVFFYQKSGVSFYFKDAGCCEMCMWLHEHA